MARTKQTVRSEKKERKPRARLSDEEKLTRKKLNDEESAKFYREMLPLVFGPEFILGSGKKCPEKTKQFYGYCLKSGNISSVKKFRALYNKEKKSQTDYPLGDAVDTYVNEKYKRAEERSVKRISKSISDTVQNIEKFLASRPPQGTDINFGYAVDCLLNMLDAIRQYTFGVTAGPQFPIGYMNNRTQYENMMKDIVGILSTAGVTVDPSFFRIVDDSVIRAGLNRPAMNKTIMRFGGTKIDFTTLKTFCAILSRNHDWRLSMVSNMIRKAKNAYDKKESGKLMFDKKSKRWIEIKSGEIGEKKVEKVKKVVKVTNVRKDSEIPVSVLVSNVMKMPRMVRTSSVVIPIKKDARFCT